MSVLTAKSHVEPRQLVNLTLSNRSLATTFILLVALIGFELFNYSTTYVALHDLLGDLTFFSLKWAAILTIAFCAIDFAGITRLFMPVEDQNLSRDTWFLFAAWLMAATMNAILTWWGISMSIASHALKSTTIVDPEILTTVVPVFVAVMVWITRILLIGSFSLSGKSLLNRPTRSTRTTLSPARETKRYVTSVRQAQTIGYAPQPVRSSKSQRSVRPAVLTPRARSASLSANKPAARPEPEYVPDPSYRTL